MSGTGIVAEGVQFSNGHCALSFLGGLHCVEVLDDIATVEAIHGHKGATEVVWIDPDFDAIKARINHQVKS